MLGVLNIDPTPGRSMGWACQCQPGCIVEDGGDKIRLFGPNPILLSGADAVLGMQRNLPLP